MDFYCIRCETSHQQAPTQALCYECNEITKKEAVRAQEQFCKIREEHEKQFKEIEASMEPYRKMRELENTNNYKIREILFIALIVICPQLIISHFYGDRAATLAIIGMIVGQNMATIVKFLVRLTYKYC